MAEKYPFDFSKYSIRDFMESLHIASIRKVDEYQAGEMALKYIARFAQFDIASCAFDEIPVIVDAFLRQYLESFPEERMR